MADQFIVVNNWDGELEMFIKDKSIGAKNDSFLCLQTQEQSDKMDALIKLVLRYKDNDDQDAVHFEIKENDDYKMLSTAADATHADFGNGQVLAFIAKSKILDRSMPLQWAIKISDDWLPFCRFLLNLFLEYVIDDDEYKDFVIETLIGRFYNRHDFCGKYYKGWNVGMG
eukprot:370419_1